MGNCNEPCHPPAEQVHGAERRDAWGARKGGVNLVACGGPRHREGRRSEEI
jgi:hypothetical protein